jgi:alpha-tubulin suppressor-like RCC1 family protein
VAAIDAGTWSSIALAADRTVLAWGYDGIGPTNPAGQPTGGAVTQPTAAAGLGDIDAVGAGYHHFATLRRDGTVHSWGGNSAGQLGDGSTTARQAPVPAVGLTGSVLLAAGGSATYAV